MGKHTLLAHWCNCSNFGDALNPWLLHKLTGRKIVYCNTFKPDIKAEVKSMLSSFLHLRSYDFHRMAQPVTDHPVILAVGSILSRSRPNYIVWGGATWMPGRNVQAAFLKLSEAPFLQRS